MNVRLGLCAFFIFVAGCSQDPDSGVARSKSAAAEAVGVSGPKFPARNPATSIASAPDRGALIAYSKDSGSIRQQGAYTLQRVALSEDHALRALVSGQMNVPMPDGGQVRLKYDRHVEDADGNWTWIGRLLDGDQMQEAIITFGEKAVFGSIPQGNGQPPLRIHTNQGALWAISTDASQVPDILSGTVDVLVPPAAAATSTAAQAGVAQSALSSAAAASTPATTIDLAIGYTGGFSAALGGDSQAATRLSFLVQVGNQSFTNSGITGSLRVVRAVKVNYVDNTANKTALQQLSGNSGTGAMTVPASLVPLRNARDEYGADLVVLVRDFQSPENDGCGIAWLNGANQVAISTADAPFGYAVVSDGYDEGNDGKTYFCADETLVHELAHLMGSAHDRENSTSSTGATLFGRYPYSFGLKSTSTSGDFYTIMAYGDNGQNFYRAFSNPVIAKCGPSNTLACGTANEADNARSLNQTIPIVAGFRAAVVPVDQRRRSDINGDGKDDLLWHNSQQSRHGFWLMNGNAILQMPNFAAASGFVIGAHGDFTGDGRLDVIWTSPQRDLYVLTSTGTAFVDGRYIGTYPEGWEIVAAGDVNGDGIDDLIWHSASVGQYGYWIMSNGAPTLMRSFFSVPGYSLIASGNFDADPYLDLIWASGAGDLLMMKGNGATFTQSPMGKYADAGRIFGAGDVNGDGRDDLLLLNKVTKTWGYWLMNGTQVTGSMAFAANPAYYPVSVSDFNGDGRADVLWSSSAQDLQLLSGNGTTFTHSPVGAFGDGWRPVDKRVRSTN